MSTTLLTIAALHWVVLLVPGFNFVLLGRLAAGGARASAFAAAGGMALGTLSWALLAVLGVGLVFAAHPALRLALQVGGGVYLLQLAWRLWRSGSLPQADVAGPMGRLAAFRAGLFTSWLNPKIALFYGSVFATALPVQPSGVLQASAVALVFANSVVWHGGLALLLSHQRVQQAWLAHARRLQQGSALVVGGFGLRLLLGTWQELRTGP